MEIRSGVVLDAKESEIPVIVLEKKKGTDYGEICFMGDWHLGCQPANSLVGLGTRIQDVRVGDYVGQGQVLKTYKREPKEGEKLYTLFITGLLPLKFTGNHPLLIARGRGKAKHGGVYIKPEIENFAFVRTEDAKVGDWVLLPKLPEEQMKIYLRPQRTWHNHTELTVDEEIARFLGFYVADGYVHRSSIVLCFNPKKDGKLINKYRTIIEKRFGRKCTLDKRGQLSFSFKALAEYLKNLGKVRTKRVPLEILYSPRHIVETFLEGYIDGDGWKVRNEYRATTVSEVLAYQLSLLSPKIEKLITIQAYEPKRHIWPNGKMYREHKCYHISIPIERKKQRYGVLKEGLTLRIEDIFVEPLREPVYNLTTTSNTYYAPIIVHNSGNFSLGQYIEYLAYLLEHPEIKVVLMGDLIEMGALSPYGASEEKVGSMQLLDVIRLLEPIKDRIIVMLEGNHEERFWRATKGTDTVTKSVADALKIHPLLPGPERGQLFMVKVGEQVYSVYAIHGSTGATIYKATQLSKVFANIHTSLAVHGHNHQIFKDHRTYYGVREIKGKYYLTVHEQYWLTTGCFVKNLGYAEKGAMPVTKIGAPFVRFYANREAIEIIDDPRITYGIGTGSKKIDLKKIGLKGLDLEKYEELRGFGGTQVLKKGRWVETEICPSVELDTKEEA